MFFNLIIITDSGGFHQPKLYNVFIKTLLALLFSLFIIYTTAQPFTHLKITRVSCKAPREGTCYDAKFGHYKCLEIPVVIMIQSGGREASISTSYLMGGQLVESVKKDFGDFNGMFFTSLQSSLANYTVTAPANSNPEIAAKLIAFVNVLNTFKNSINISNNPEDVYYLTTTTFLYELTNSFLQSDASVAEQTKVIEENSNRAKALIEIAGKGIADVSISLIPFVGDARDLYEMINGRDLLTKEKIDSWGRVLSGVALVVGSGALYRKALQKMENTFAKKIVNESIGEIPKLRYTGSGSWLSEAGIVYRKSASVQGKYYENNLRHILRHCTENGNKTVFSLAPKDVPKLIDEAWLKKGAKLAEESKNDVYVVDIGRVIGTKNERKVRVVMVKGTSEIVTAYPQ